MSLLPIYPWVLALSLGIVLPDLWGGPLCLGALLLWGSWRRGWPCWMAGLLGLHLGLGNVLAVQQRAQLRRQSFRHPIASQPPSPPHQPHWSQTRSKAWQVRGVVLGRGRAAGGWQRYTVKIERLRSGSWEALPGRLELKMQHRKGDAALGWGERFRATARLRLKARYANPGTYPKGAKLWAWTASCKSHQWSRLGAPGAGWRQRLDQLRARLSLWIQGSLSQGQAAALLQALLLGERGGLSDATRRHFALTGTAHLLAISGLHLAIVGHVVFLLVAGLLSRSAGLLLGGWPRSLAAAVAWPITWSYGLLSGASPSTQRAMVMLAFVWFGICMAQRIRPGQLLGLAAWILLVRDPSALSSTSFQMSFVAVGALLLHCSPSAEGLRGQRWRAALLASLQASAVAAAATFPLALSFSSTAPVWGPLWNLLAVPLGGYAVVATGLASIALWPFCLPIATGLLKLSGAMAGWLLEGIGLAARLPTPEGLAPPDGWQTAAFYCGLAGLLLWRRWPRGARAAACLGLALLLLGGLASSSRKPGLLEVRFFDVGQGDAALIRCPNGAHLLIDAGGKAYGSFDVGKKVLLPALRRLGVSRLDIALLSHPHPDHFGGFVALLSALPVAQFWHTGQPGRHPRYRSLRQVLRQKATPTRRFQRPETRWLGEVRLEILHPFPHAHEGGTYYWSLHANDNSLVVRLCYREICILFAGDLERRGEQLLALRHRDLRAQVLKVPHHGSRTSSTEAFLQRVAPKHAIFSLGRGHHFGFPHRQVLARYHRRKIRIWRTDLHGQIALWTDGKHLQFESFLKPPRGP